MIFYYLYIFVISKSAAVEEKSMKGHHSVTNIPHRCLFHRHDKPFNFASPN